MRVMVTTAGGFGHFYPLVPLANTLLESGAEVRVAVPEYFHDAASSLGFTTIPLRTPGVTAPSAAAKAAQRACPPYQRGRLVLGRYLADSVAQVPSLLSVLDDWRPDVLVRDSTAFAAWLAGEALDIPVAVFDHAGAPTKLLAATTGDLFDDARRSAGLAPDPGLASLNRWLHLLGAPADWFTPHTFGATSHLFQPPVEVPVGDATLTWLDELDPARPFVYVTLGTVHNDTPGLFEAVLDVLATESVQVLATIGPDADPRRFESLPAHIRVAPFVPQSLVLPHVDAMICHWGYGTLMGPLCLGIPVVLFPLASGDSAAVAARVERLGVGVVLSDDGWTKAGIRAALRSVLDDGRYRFAARQVAKSVDVLPPFRAAGPLVEELARTRQPVVNPQFAGRERA